MQHNHPSILDIQHAARTGTTLQGRDMLSNYERLCQESQEQDGEKPLHWTARFDMRGEQTEGQSAWLYLTVDTSLVQICQRCLLPVDVQVRVDRQFRFVASETIAEQQDEDCEEDLLVISRTFDLAALIEDEVLLGLPLVPIHDRCPVPVKTAVADEAFENQSVKPNPFAALGALNRK